VKRLNELWQSLDGLSWDLYDFNGEVLTRALKLKKHNEFLSEVAWWATAILVLLAFTVAVLSRKYGEESLEFETAVGQVERLQKKPPQERPSVLDKT
jgi:hypothetical protein